MGSEVHASEAGEENRDLASWTISGARPMVQLAMVKGYSRAYAFEMRPGTTRRIYEMEVEINRSNPHSTLRPGATASSNNSVWV